MLAAGAAQIIEARDSGAHSAPTRLMLLRDLAPSAVWWGGSTVRFWSRRPLRFRDL